MNEHIDPLEAELSALRPRDPSPQLEQRLAGELEIGTLIPARSRTSRVWWSGVITGLVAASLVMGVLLRPAPDGKPEIESPLPPLRLPIAAAFDDALPTVWTYRRALTRPPHELEALLDEHAALGPPRGGPAPSHLFIRSDRELHFNGEL